MSNDRHILRNKWLVAIAEFGDLRDEIDGLEI